MEAIGASSVLSVKVPTWIFKTQHTKPKFVAFPHDSRPSSGFSKIQGNTSKLFKFFTAISPSPFSVSTESVDPPEPEVEDDTKAEKFDWFSHWYPVMPVCDLDKRVPHGKKVMGLDVVVWWDRNEKTWKVFDDACPHRLAPLSEGRIDQWGRLQCVYHGWCFNGSGDCKFIPQAPQDGPPVHTFKKACAAVYPSTLHHDIVWFWPSTDPAYKDIIQKEKPPFLPELVDPSFTKLMGNRDIPYGYDVLIENLMDPAHVPYAHYGLMQTRKPKEKRDREGGRPVEMRVKKLGVNGFIAKQEWGGSKFIAPCIFYAYTEPEADQGTGAVSSAGTQKQSSAQRRAALIFICVPVSPGNSRLIWTFPRNLNLGRQNCSKMVLSYWPKPDSGFRFVSSSCGGDSKDKERKLMDIGPANWQKACFLPTKSDALVVGFRRWLNKYAGGGVDWRGKYSGALPPTPPREQLMDRYWSHVLNCSSCSTAHKGLNALEVTLQVLSVVLIGVVAATKQSMTSTVARNTAVAMAIICFAASRWLAHFIYRNFHYHDYNHAFR